MSYSRVSNLQMKPLLYNFDVVTTSFFYVNVLILCYILELNMLNLTLKGVAQQVKL